MASLKSIVGNRFVDLFLFGKIPLAPWRDEESRQVFWSIAVHIDALASAAQQAFRLAMNGPEWPIDAISYIARNRGVQVPRQTGFDFRAWLSAASVWAQHAKAGTYLGILAGVDAVTPLPVGVDWDSDGFWWLTAGTVAPDWDDGSEWDDGDSPWDVVADPVELQKAYDAALFWGSAKTFLGFEAGGL